MILYHEFIFTFHDVVRYDAAFEISVTLARNNRGKQPVSIKYFAANGCDNIDDKALNARERRKHKIILARTTKRE